MSTAAATGTTRGVTIATGLLVGWIADELLGDPRRAHPVAMFGRGAGWLEQHLWADRRGRGLLYTAVAVGVPTAVTVLTDRRLRSPTARMLLTAAVTWTALGGRSLRREARGVADAVHAGDLRDARRRLPALVGRDPSGLDGVEITRAACESVAENTADAAVATFFWGAVAGPAGIAAHRCVNTLDAMVGHRSPRHARFGWAAARLDDLANWVPARLTALLAAALAPAVHGTARAACRTARRDGRRHPSPNAGVVEAAFAGALGVRLGGTNQYGDRVEQRGPLGSGPPPDADAVHRAARLSALVGAAAVVLCAAAAWSWRSGVARRHTGDRLSRFLR